jgi:regulator of protease activity HflC (stomatin/prohibitin superfamily)
MEVPNRWIRAYRWEILAEPEQMIRAIARQAEAERERRAKIIRAEGEAAAAANLEKAAETMARQPGAIQLRYLQTLLEIGAEKNTTVVFLLPIDFLSSLGQVLKKLGGSEPGAAG